MLKRYLCLVLVLVTVFALVACSTEEQPASPSPEPPAADIDVFDFSLVEHIGSKTDVEILELLGLSEADVTREFNAIYAGTIDYAGKSFERVLNFTVNPDSDAFTLAGIGYNYTFADGTAVSEMNDLTKSIYTSMAELHGSSPDDDSLGDKFDKEDAPEGTVYWSDPANSDFIFTVRAYFLSTDAERNPTGYTIQVGYLAKR